MPSYLAKGRITYFTNKTENAYSFFQYYDGSDRHVIHYTDDDLMLYISNDGVYSKYNNEETVRIADADDGYKYIFPDCFFESYYSKETSSSNNKSRYVQLETEIYNDSLSSLKMWIDCESLNPFRIQVLDVDLNPLCEVIFDEFIEDAQIESEIFEF